MTYAIIIDSDAFTVVLWVLNKSVPHRSDVIEQDVILKGKEGDEIIMFGRKCIDEHHEQ